MKLKEMAKSLLGFFRCKFSGIQFLGKEYIGRGVNIKGGKNIMLAENVCIRPDVDLWCVGAKVAIGPGTEIGERDRISIAHTLTIGKRVLLSPNVYITDCDHEYRNIDMPVMDQGIVQKDFHVEIKDNAFIGINSVIVGNVTIGRGSVVGANSVVTHDVPDYCVVVGVPAKIIRRYNVALKKWERVSG